MKAISQEYYRLKYRFGDQVVKNARSVHAFVEGESTRGREGGGSEGE